MAKFITLNPVFEYMLGFIQTEVNTLFDTIDPATRTQVDKVIKSQ
jgi:hypothetical protein